MMREELNQKNIGLRVLNITILDAMRLYVVSFGISGGIDVNSRTVRAILADD